MITSRQRLEALTAAERRVIMPGTPYVPQAPQTLPDDPAAAEPASVTKAKAAADKKAAAGGTGTGNGSKFKEYLHLRGQDGRFITKGAIVNVTDANGQPQRGRVTSLTPDGPVVRYDNGTEETVPLADATTRITSAPKPIARITTTAARSRMAELPYEQAQRWNAWAASVSGTYDPNDNCTLDAAEVIRTGQLPDGAENGCIGPADGKLAQFLQRVHREGASALNQGDLGDDDRAVALWGAKKLGYQITTPSGPKPKAPKAAPKPKAVKKKAAPKPKKAKKVKWSPWG